MPNPNRFIFSANAFAVADNVEPPTQAGKAWASVGLPMTGGTVTAGPVSDSNAGLSFRNATASVKGWFDGAYYVTENTARVENVNIEEWLHADVIEVKLTFKFQKNPLDLVVDVNRNPYTGLSIAGQNFSNVTLDDTDPKGAGHNHPIVPGRPYHHHKSKSQKDLKLHTSIARDRDNETPQSHFGRLKFVGQDYGYVDVAAAAGQRRVYFGEWAEEEDWQGVIGLRVEFMDDKGNLTRQIAIADYLGNNGQFYP
jgi:hypothetical protein